MIAVVAGLAAGAAHVLTGPDHLAALAPLAADDPRRGVRIGAFWGLGHGLGVLIAAGIARLLSAFVTLEELGAWSERIVGVVLIAIGTWALRKALRHAAAPATAGHHAHDHGHGHGHAHTSFWVGTLHGSAGAGHLLGVLPSLALPGVEAALYLGAYFVAAIAAMASVGFLVGRFTAVAGARRVRAVLVTTSLVALGIGAWWVVASFTGDVA